jgi:hypothetical protein
VAAASRQFSVRDGGIQDREAALGRIGVRGKCRVLRGGQTHAGEGNRAGARDGFCTKAERKNGGGVRAHPCDRGRSRGAQPRSCHAEEDVVGGGMAANGVRMGGIHGQPAAAGQCRGAHEPWRGVVHVGCVEGVGGSGKGGSWAGPRATMLIFYLNEFPN